MNLEKARCEEDRNEKTGTKNRQQVMTFTMVAKRNFVLMNERMMKNVKEKKIKMNDDEEKGKEEKKFKKKN